MRRKVVTLSPLLGMVPPNTKIYCRGLSLCKKVDLGKGYWKFKRKLENFRKKEKKYFFEHFLRISVYIHQGNNKPQALKYITIGDIKTNFYVVFIKKSLQWSRFWPRLLSSR